MTGGNITIFDIAKEAGVSIATVSRALSDQYNPRSAKHRKVLEIAQKYNYLPNPAARSLGTGQTNLLCIVLPEISNPYYSELFGQTEEAASREGYSLIMQREHSELGDYQQFLDQLIGRRPDGIIMCGGIVECPQNPEKLKVLRTLSQYMPIVVIGQKIDGFPCVSIYCDLAEGARLSVRHLYALGHRRIAMLGGLSVNRSSNEREQGYFDEMTRLGLEANFEYRHKTGYTTADGEAGVLKILQGLPRGQWPTALIAINDLVAMGAMRQLSKLGLRVPEDIAIVGCDNQFFAPYLHSPLTTLDLNLKEVGKLAVHYLLTYQPGMAFHHALDSTLVIRESCGAKLGARTF